MLHLLAQTTQDAASTQPSVTPPWWANPGYMFYGLLGLIVLFVFSSSGRAARQQEKRHKDLLASLKRGDRVQTIGGILGSVVETRENEVVLKIDEGSNTKIRVTRDAIKKVMSEESETK